MRHHPKRFATPPVDPRSRKVEEIVERRGRYYRLRLECGHEVRRKLMLTPPPSLICGACPAAGGMTMDSDGL